MLKLMLKKSSDVIRSVIIAMLVTNLFSVGESVLVLQKDSTLSKVFSKCIGPAIVVEIQSPHLYVVEFDGGSKRTIHALSLIHISEPTRPY